MHITIFDTKLGCSLSPNVLVWNFSFSLRKTPSCNKKLGSSTHKICECIKFGLVSLSGFVFIFTDMIV